MFVCYCRRAVAALSFAVVVFAFCVQFRSSEHNAVVVGRCVDTASTQYVQNVHMYIVHMCLLLQAASFNVKLIASSYVQLDGSAWKNL